MTNNTSTDLKNAVSTLVGWQYKVMVVKHTAADAWGWSVAGGDSDWAKSIVDLLRTSFKCKHGGVFHELVVSQGVCGEPGFRFVPVGTDAGYGKANIVYINSFKDFIASEDKKVYECKILHEFVHFLHERWKVNAMALALADKSLDIEDIVTGCAEYGKLDNAIKTGSDADLLMDYKQLTENGFRVKRGLAILRSYGGV
jgi:hypothetical protein